jgi:hypothetical protein
MRSPIIGSDQKPSILARLLQTHIGEGDKGVDPLVVSAFSVSSNRF